MSHGAGRLSTLVVTVLLATSCGKKGPPLPPLVRIPAAPGDVVAERRGDRVDVRFVVPAENTDGSRPANIQRVDVYAWTGPANVSDDLVLKHGTRIGSVDVKAPRDPNATVEPDEPIGDVEPPVGPGLDQGAAAAVHETLTADALKPVDVPGQTSSDTPPETGPLVGPVRPVLSRTYVAVGISTRRRLGPLSGRVAVPLLPAPPPAAQPNVTYDETSITVTWAPASAAAVQPPAPDPVLEATPLGMPVPTIAYNVYDVAPAVGRSANRETTTETRLTETPVAETAFVDTRIEWGLERCYTVRVVRGLDDLRVESEAAPPRCTKLTDTFAPAAPQGVTPVASQGAINLIWDPNLEMDLSGYIVLRAAASGQPLTPLTPAPIPGTGFTDTVKAGTRYVYAVQAVDKAGNVSAQSEQVEETAR